MKSLRLLAAALLACCLAACATLTGAGPARDRALLGDGIGIDHVPVWSRDGAVTAQMLENLGFNLRAAERHPDGVETRPIVFANGSYLELFSVYDRAKAQAQAPVETEFLRLSFGPTNFGLETTEIEAAQARLTALGVPARLDAVAGTPRLLTPEQGRIPGEPFLVDYDRPARPASDAEHPNTARRITAVWVVTPDLKAAAAAYRGLGLSVSAPQDVRHLQGRAVKVRVGSGWILLVEPVGEGLASRALSRVGHKVFGVSLEVADLGAVTSLLSAASQDPWSYSGPFGRALGVPTEATLGLTLEFHAR